MARERRIRTDGFSDDGLSYSVAADFNKQMGQAMAEQEARLKSPRFVAGGRVEEPDAPDILQRELIDPVLTGFGMGREFDRGYRGDRYSRGNRPDSASAFSTVKGKDDAIYAFDKRTGQAQLINPNDPQAAITAEAEKLVPDNASQTANWFQNSPVMRNEEAEAIAKLNQPGADPVDILGVQHPTLLANPPYATRFGPMYRSGQERKRRLENATPKPGPSVSTRMSERQKLAKMLEAPGIAGDTAKAVQARIAELDNQFKLANMFLEQAGGDPREAERLAKEAGHEFE